MNKIENETLRQRALDSYGVLDVDRDPAIEALVALAATLCNAPVAMVSMIDRERQWALASVGLVGPREIPRAAAFCAHAIEGRELMQVEDAAVDPRFEDNPLVTGAPHIRFYAGVPLVDADGFALGALCVIDVRPRALSGAQEEALAQLTLAVMALIAARRTERQRRDALLRSERRNALLNLAEDVADAGHWRIELAAGRVFWSPHTFAMLGRDPLTFRPNMSSALDICHPEDLFGVVEAIRDAAVQRRPFDFEMRALRADGEIRRLRVRGRVDVEPVSGNASAIFGVFQNITEQHSVRQRMQRHERLVTAGTLAAGVGHEINNPLTYVSANVEYALDELRRTGGPEPSDSVRELLDVLAEAKEGAARIRKIVRGLRAFAREESEPVATDVHVALDLSINMAMHEMRHTATVVRRFGSVPPVLSDEARLSQVFVNLLVNAAHAFLVPNVEGNRIEITTSTASTDRVVIEIADNGSGMTPDTLHRIFEPFFTTKTPGRGTGLGLAICQNLIASLGGEISCVSSVGEGTVFRIELPVAASALPPAAPTLPPVRVTRGRLLVIEDEEAVLRVLMRALEPEHHVVALSDSRLAARLLADPCEGFDVVLCDIDMPKFSGIDLYRQVAVQRPDMGRCFVFLTGGAGRDDVREFLSGIPNEMIEKPFAIQNVRAAVRRLVEARASPASSTRSPTD